MVPFQGFLKTVFPPLVVSDAFVTVLMVTTGSGGDGHAQPLLLLLCHMFKYILFFLIFFLACREFLC